MNDQPTIDEIWDAGHLRSESISARLDGELIEGADAHLISCDECQNRLAEFTMVRTRMSAFLSSTPNILDLLSNRALEEMTGGSPHTSAPDIASASAPVIAPSMAAVTDLALRRTQRSKRFMAIAAVAAVAVIGIGVGSVVRANRPVAPNDQLAEGDSTPQLKFGESSTISPVPPGAVTQETDQSARSSAGTSSPTADAAVPAPLPDPPLSATELTAKNSAELPTGVPPTAAHAIEPTAPNTKQLDAVPPASQSVGSGALSKAPAAGGAGVAPTLPVLDATSPEALQILLTNNPALVDTLVLAGPCLTELTTALGGAEVRLGAAHINAHNTVIGVTRTPDKKGSYLRIAEADPISCFVTEISVPIQGPSTTNAK